MDLKYQPGLWRLIALTIAGFQLCTSSTVSTPPQPVTTTPGSEFKITCGITTISTTEGVRIKRVVVEGTTGEETVYQSLPADWVDTNFDKTKYSIEGAYPLVTITVKNVAFKDAGKYICEPIVIPDERVTAFVIVLGPPLLTLPKKIHSGEEFKATCEAQFAAHSDQIEGNTHFPQMISLEGQREIEGTTTVTRGELGTDINSKMDMVINTTLTESSNGEIFSCVFRTSNPPGETKSSEILDILFPVTKPEIPKNDLFYVGESIICTARGNPEPTIMWKPVTSKIKGVYPNNLTIVEGMMGDPAEVWTCEASNDPRIPVVEAAEITFNVEKKADGNTGETKTPGSQSVAIAVGVTVPVVLIIIAVIIVVFVFMRNRKGSQRTQSKDELAENTNKNAGNLGNNNGKPGPLASDATYDDVADGAATQPKPNSQGHNVRIQGDDPAASAKRPMSPLYEVAQQAAEPDRPNYYEVVPQYPDMMSAHPGLQKAMQGQDRHQPLSPTYSVVNKPKAQPRQQNYNDDPPDTAV